MPRPQTFLLTLVIACGACDAGPTDAPTDRSTDATDATDATDVTDDTDATDVATGDTSTTPCPAPSFELGTAFDEHAPLLPGGQVVLVHGIQGGWHVNVSGLVVGIDDAQVQITGAVVLSDGRQLAGEQGAFVVPLALTEDGCGGTFVGARLFVDDLELPAEFDSYQAFICSLVGAGLTVWAEVRGIEDPTALSAEVSAVAANDPLDRDYFCD